jgi:hypothetical protein
MTMKKTTKMQTTSMMTRSGKLSPESHTNGFYECTLTSACFANTTVSETLSIVLFVNALHCRNEQTYFCAAFFQTGGDSADHRHFHLHNKAINL